MIPKEKIIEEAIRQEVDIIGLSGLITPSLDEMTAVAAEMEKQKLNIPLLIGGATTSKIHTAVKIAPSYSGPVYHVKDASRSVGLVSDLLNEGRKAEREKIRLAEYEQIREEHRSGKGKPEIISQEEALQNRFVWTEDRADIRKPLQTGIRVYRDLTLEELIPLIDWTFFFHQWRINGKYPAIFNDPVKGKEAKKLFADAQELLLRIVNEKWVVANAVAGIFPAFSEGNHVIVRCENGTSEKLSFLRNTEKKDDGIPNLCLADYIAGSDKKVEDYMGFFAVTAGLGTEKAEQEFKEKNDDYSAIMLRILADRLAEAAAEWIHREVRVQLWGYSPGENLSADELLAGKYRGIRPAPGYPACPVHSEKAIIFRLLEAEKNTGISLTENFAMNPAASVCGYIFAHPEANYFAVNS
jgi:5-methyltetrahydrofolate--homocysteine methyltransferase